MGTVAPITEKGYAVDFPVLPVGVDGTEGAADGGTDPAGCILLLINRRIRSAFL